MKYLILGSNGQLAKEFIKKIDDDIFAYGKDKLDITNEKLLKEAIDSIKPDFIINCAAYNNVDGAETDFKTAFNVNALAVKNIALFSQKYKSIIIHFSTDYVFSSKKVPYTEKDTPSPINKYGLSKLEGEKLLKENYENFIIFRVSWLYGDGTQNFVYKFLNWAKEKSELRVSTDEVSVPTPTELVVDITLKSLKEGLKGVWHLCSSGFCSRYEWAVEIAKVNNLDVKILEAKQKDFNLPARRPEFSAMDNSNLSKIIAIDIPVWHFFKKLWKK